MSIYVREIDSYMTDMIICSLESGFIHTFIFGASQIFEKLVQSSSDFLSILFFEQTIFSKFGINFVSKACN